MTMKPEVKSFQFELKSLDEAGKFSGYLAVFGNVDAGGDRIEKGAFSRTLNTKNRFSLLWQHRMDKPIGGFTGKEDEHGLLIDGELNLGVQQAQEAYALLKKRDIDGLSIGYDAVKYDMEASTGENRIRVLKEIKLYEGSLVTFPMNESAVVTDVKSLADLIEAIKGDPEAAAKMREAFADPVKATPQADPVQTIPPDEDKSASDIAAHFVAALETVHKSLTEGNYNG
jgi:hypothetical protein